MKKTLQTDQHNLICISTFYFVYVYFYEVNKATPRVASVECTYACMLENISGIYFFFLSSSLGCL